MTFQWRKLMDQWIKETAPSKTWGEDRDGMAERRQSLTCHMLLRVFVSLFFSFNRISQLHSAAPAFAQTSMSTVVNQCYKWSNSQSAVVCCHTDFVLILAAWNIWLRVPSWAPCLKSEVKRRGSSPISDIIYLKHMYSTQEISTTLYCLIKAPLCVAVFARGTLVNGYSVSFQLALRL